MTRPSTIEGYEEELDAADALIQRQQERIERLEEALQKIVNEAPLTSYGTAWQMVKALQSHAVAALAEGKQHSAQARATEEGIALDAWEKATGLKSGY